MFGAAGAAGFDGAGFFAEVGEVGTGFFDCTAGFAAFFALCLAGFFMPRNLHEPSSDRQRGSVLREVRMGRERASTASGSPVRRVRIQSLRSFAPRLS